mmetsp:Transcript_22480/g.33463  ORF Transcript_22480/g.33463 Transcript_22480/m.33463 type:complete len:95 (+) Transcript_22480:282-566(+)
MYAICVVGSNSPYLVDLLSNIMAVPIIVAECNTAGFSTPKNTVQAKKGMATIDITAGVARAPTRQPRIFMILLPKNMTTNVARPTIEEKFPINL